MISDKVMKSDDFDSSIFYKIDCDCMDNNCIITIEMEYDERFNDITLTFFKKIALSSHWGNLNFFKRQIKNIKAALKILFTGYIELEGSFIISEKEHIEAFIEALNEGKDKIAEYKENL